MTLPAEDLPVGAARPALVLIHGWGSNGACWDPIRPYLQRHFDLVTVALPGHERQDAYEATADAGHWADSEQAIDKLIESWLEVLPAKASYIGWSLGGTLAARLAYQHPERVDALVTLATNPCFVQREDWRHAMPKADFEQFTQRLSKSPGRCLSYFAGLQSLGDKHPEDVRKALAPSDAQSTPNAGALAAGLRALADLDLREIIAKVDAPQLAILGSEDKLVPAAVGAELPATQTTWIAQGCAHAPHISRPEATAARICDFILQRSPAPGAVRSKQAVAQSFGQAVHYDDAATLQREAGHALARRLTQQNPAGQRWKTALDLGCGTGYFIDSLREHANHTIGLDLAEGMLHRANTERADSSMLSWLCGDAEHLPLADACIDTVFSSLAVQWCENLSALTAELSRVLQPGGMAALATLGPNTLWELRAAWRAVDSAVHVNRFAPIDHLVDHARAAGLEIAQYDREHWLRRTPNVRKLARELRAIGAHNINPGRRAGLTGKRRWQQVDSAYRSLADDDALLPVTWELGFLILKKPGSKESQ